MYLIHIAFLHNYNSFWKCNSIAVFNENMIVTSFIIYKVCNFLFPMGRHILTFLSSSSIKTHANNRYIIPITHFSFVRCFSKIRRTPIPKGKSTPRILYFTIYLMVGFLVQPVTISDLVIAFSFTIINASQLFRCEILTTSKIPFLVYPFVLFSFHFLSFFQIHPMRPCQFPSRLRHLLSLVVLFL